MEAVLDDAYILIHEKKISSARDLVPVAEQGRRAGQAAADHRRGRRRRGPRDPRRQQAPRHAQGRAPSRPPASATAARRCSKTSRSSPAAQAIFEELGIKLENVELNQLGRAKKIRVDKDNTTIIEGAGDEKAIKGRIEQLKNEIDNTTSDYDREKLQERLAKLAGGVAQINVGAATEVAMKEKKARVEDALHACRAAVEEGILPGGGVAVIRAAARVARQGPQEGRQRRPAGRRRDRPPRRRSPHQADRRKRRRRRRRRRPEGQGVNKDVNFGYNALTHEYGDLIKMGVIVPTKVERTALQNAASIASLLLTTDAIVSEIKEDKPEPAGAPGGGGMY